MAFQKVNGEYSYSRAVTALTQMSASLSAQWAFTNLDSGESMVLGGSGGVRGWSSADAGDIGWLGKLELRTVLPLPQWPGLWRASGFLEGGGVQVRRFPEDGDPIYIQRYGVGIGLTWSLSEQSTLQWVRAWPIGAESETERRGQMYLSYVLQF